MANDTTHVGHLRTTLAPLAAYPHFMVSRNGSSIPETLSGSAGKNNDPRTWCTLDEALSACTNGTLPGFVFTRACPFVAMDLDAARDPDTENPAPWAIPIIDEAIAGGCYVEVSKSGTGFHIIGTHPHKEKLWSSKAKHIIKVPGAPRINRKQAQIEVFLGHGSPPGGAYLVLTCDLQAEGTMASSLESTLDTAPGLYGDREPKTRLDASDSKATGSGQRADVESALKHINPDCDYDQWFRILAALHSTGESWAFDLAESWSSGGSTYKKGEVAKKWKSFRPEGGISIATLFKAAKDNGWRPSRFAAEGPPDWTTEPEDVGAGDEWPELIPLDDPPVSDISPRMLPGWLGDMVQAVVDQTEMPGSIVVGQALATLAACAQCKFCVQIEVDHCEPLVVWSMGLLDPGTRKTKIVSLLTAPIHAWEADQARKLQSEIDEAVSMRKTLQEDANALRKQRAKQKDPHERERMLHEIAKIEERLPIIPSVPVIYAEDVTPEHLGTMMGQQSGSMAIISDEGGLLDNFLGRYSSGVPNIDLILKGHSGSSVKVNRGSREPVWIDCSLLTMGLTPQRSVLADIAKSPQFAKRGGLARFEYALPVNPLGSRKLEPRPIPGHISEAYCSNLTELLDMKAPEDMLTGKPVRHVLTPSKAAYAEWKDFQRMMEPTMLPGSRYGEYPIRGWVAKLPGLAARYAGLLHVAKHLAEAPSIEISRDTMGVALELAVARISHAEAAFALTGQDERTEKAKKVLDVIRAQTLIRFSKRDIHYALKGSVAKAKDLDEPLQILVDKGYIRPVAQKSKVGRPSERYETRAEAFPYELEN